MVEPLLFPANLKFTALLILKYFGKHKYLVLWFVKIYFSVWYIIYYSVCINFEDN